MKATKLNKKCRGCHVDPGAGGRVISVECACRVCRGNNDGRPMAALIPEALHRKLGGDVHGTVWSAHEPGVLGAAVRQATGIQPA